MADFVMGMRGYTVYAVNRSKDGLKPSLYVRVGCCIQGWGKPAQGTIHLTQTVHYIGAEGGKHEELVERMNNDTLAEAEAYLKNVEQRFYHGDLAQFHLQVTLSVVPHSDATEIWKRIVEEAVGTAQVPACDIIAMTTHGRHGLQHLLEGSITESVLDASMHPLLVVHDQGVETEEETLAETHHV